MEILTPTEEKPLFEIDENRLNEMMQLCLQICAPGPATTSQ